MTSSDASDYALSSTGGADDDLAPFGSEKILPDVLADDQGDWSNTQIGESVRFSDSICAEIDDEKRLLAAA
jgi:hypothetical protein